MTNDRSDRKANLDSNDPTDHDVGLEDKKDTARSKRQRKTQEKSSATAERESGPATQDVGECEDLNDDTTDEGETPNETEVLKDQLLRALAETENVRKRAEREREEAAKYGVSSFARDIVSITDNLQRALDSVPDFEGTEKEDDPRIKSLQAGISLTQQEFETVLTRHGIKRIEPLGKAFDHNYHQAMFELESEDHAAGTVIQVLQPGYKIHDRLLRPAMVGVAKKSTESAKSDD